MIEDEPLEPFRVGDLVEAKSYKSEEIRFYIILSMPHGESGYVRMYNITDAKLVNFIGVWLTKSYLIKNEMKIHNIMDELDNE
jgi:hypothetical protein